MYRIGTAIFLTSWLLAGCALPKGDQARVQKITSKKQLIGGPHALGDVGDYLLENADVRFIIQSEGYSRGFGMFGGSLIDADIQRPMGPGDENGPRGQDWFAEMFPAFFLVAMEPKEVLDLQDMQMHPAMEYRTNDDKSASVIVRGKGGQFIALTETINSMVVNPGPLRFQTEYRLPAKGRTLEMTTTVFNDDQLPHRFRSVPLLSALLDVPFGDVVLFAAGNKVFVPGDGGFDLRYKMEQHYGDGLTLPALPGLIGDFLATRGKAVSYGFFLPVDQPEKNFVMTHASAYGSRAQPGRLLVPFNASSFTGVFHSQPPEYLASGQNWSFTRYFAVGNGDVASIAEEVYRVRGTEVGSVSGRVMDAFTAAPVEGASVILLDAAGEPVNQATTRAEGVFTMPMPPGDYTAVVVATPRPITAKVPVHVEAGRGTALELRTDPPATLSVVAYDTQGAPLPCKVTLVASYAAENAGKDPKSFLFNLALGEEWRGVDLVPDTSEAPSRRYIEDAFLTPNGSLREDIRPGKYQVVVSRGPEYDVFTQDIDVGPGKQAEVRATLERSVDTSGYVSADLHVHSVKSIDSSLESEPRVISYAAEGVEVLVATDHNYITDHAPTVAALGLDPWLKALVGLELTTMEMGHFNGYPLRYDPTAATHGSFEWSTRTPDEIFNALRDLGELGTDRTIVQVNHPRDTIMGLYNQFVWNQETGVADGQQNPILGINTTHYPNFAKDKFSFNYDALEVLNGKHLELVHNYVVPAQLPPPPLPETIPPVGQPMRDDMGYIAFPGAAEDWFQMLRLGHTFTGVANSDSHGLLFEEAGYPRNYVHAKQEAPTLFTPEDLVNGIRSANVLMTNGPFVTVQVEGVPMGGLAATRDGKVRVHGEVRVANWVHPATLTLWVGGVVDRVLELPADFRVFGFDEEVAVGTGADSYVVLEVSGGQNLFPVVSTYDEPSLMVSDAIRAIAGSAGFGGNPYGNLQPDRTHTITPFAMTNPVFVDGNGNGQYDPPGLLHRYPAPTTLVQPPPGMPHPERAGAPRMLDLLRKPVKGQALDIRRIFFAHSNH